MEYRIHIRETGGRKLYVDPEGQEGVYLYPGEIKKKRLSDGICLTEVQLEELRKEYAIPRAKKRALGILVKQDKTEQELREKLKDAKNDSISIDVALQFVLDAGYVDDDRYARDYLRTRRGRKSFRMIRMELGKKGISSEILDAVFEEEENQAVDDVRSQFEKYIRRFPEMDRTARQKTYAHFCRKGYSGDLIRQLLEECQEEKSGMDDFS